MNLKEFITKLQNLSDKQKKIVLWTIVVILGLIMGYFWLNSAVKKFSKLENIIPEINLPEIETPLSDALDNLISDQTSTADWETYKNDEYGFEIKYPQSWKTVSDFPGRLGPGQTERREGIDPKDFNFAPNNKDLTIGANGDIILYVAPTGYSCIGITEANDNNISDFLNQNKGKDEIEFCKSDVYFRFSLITKSQEEIFNKILPTFKFIKADETADWKTYTNTEYGFEIKYPEDGILKEVSGSSAVDIYVNFQTNRLQARISSWPNDEQYKSIDELISGEKEKQNQGKFSVLGTIPQNYKEIELGGASAVEWDFYHETAGKIGMDVIVLRDGYFHDIIVRSDPLDGGYLSEFTDENETVFREMLSAFKFIE